MDTEIEVSEWVVQQENKIKQVLTDQLLTEQKNPVNNNAMADFTWKG